jgi:hypothetical protein
MTQNGFQTFVARLLGSGTGPNLPLNLDAQGNLLVASQGGGEAVSIADGSDVAQGTTTDAAYVSGAGTLVAILKGIFAKVSAPLVKPAGLKYVTCAAGGTQALGTGAVGDVLSKVVITPLLAACGTVSIKDGAGGAVIIFDGGGTTALPSLAPITVLLDAASAAGGWSIVNGASVTAIATGEFTP